jgi:hypothetical protein
VQRQIKPPPGLDLDAWIVPPLKKEIPTRAVDEEVTSKKKKKKGKEKAIIEGDEVSVKKKKKSATAGPKQHSDALTPEEAAELERVGILHDYPVNSNVKITWVETIGTTRAPARRPLLPYG